MDFAYSPHRDGGTMHLPSPTHPHGYRLEGTHFSSIQQLRHSLSRSPSKPSRFQLRSGRPDSPGSPISPLALARAFSPKAHKPSNSPMSGYPESPLATQAAPAVKKKFTLRRSAPFRSSPRTRTAANKSPRRVLVDSTDRANSTPFVVQSAPGEENMPARRTNPEHPSIMNAENKRYELNDKPIKFEFARRQDMSPAKASPLKRNDGLMNLNEESCSSPVAKRRSLHGPTSLGSDFENIFDQSPAPRSPKEDFTRSHDSSNNGGFAFSSPAKPHSPLRRTTSLRKSTLSQRFGGASTPRPKPTYDGEFAIPGPAASAASKARNRMSLDSSLQFSSGTTQSPFRKSTFEPLRIATPQPFIRGGAGSHQPHPLSHALTPSSSSSSLVQDSPMHAPPPPPAPSAMPPPGHPFAKSLPIGATRPHPQQNGPDSFETPFSFKTAKPEPIAFSTGLLSKKNRNVDDPAEGPGKYVMPDTPSKRQSYPPAVFERSETVDTPFVKRGSSLFGKTSRPRPEFGTPSTPFSAHASKLSAESFGKGSSIFGDLGNSHQRRGSFASVDGEEPVVGSPSGNHMTDSQSSADDMPPTPTKGHDGSSRRSKESSLRRKTFRQRPTLSTETFAPPVTPTVDDYTSATFGASTPHTPSDSFAPPDPSRLSISGHRRDSAPFNSSTASYLPATPTARRDQASFFIADQPVIPIGLTKNDVDESLHSRFHDVKLLEGAEGEFSKVYRVSKPVGQSPLGSPAGSQVYVVKKSKKPYLGVADRDKKMREVNTLYALRGNEHVLSIHDHWEESGHLYIQTEYCEGGNLRKFLNSAGFSSRLDDFRIWKILLELSLGVKFIHESGFIHLDLKPANILIDFEGVLKIGDFGLASPWPAPAHIDGEGDRHYLAPEALQGRYDKPADIFALGVMLAEIAGNCVIPEYGEHWQKLRSGEFKNVLPSLTWSAESSTLSRDSNGDPIPEDHSTSVDTLLLSDADIDPLGPVRLRSAINADEELSKAPQFMVDEHNKDSMDQVVMAMMHPDPDQRPTAEQVYLCFGCQWVERRRRAGATVYEGNFGPGDEVLAYDDQHHFDAADMMDIS